MCWNVQGLCGDQHLLERTVGARTNPRLLHASRLPTTPSRGSSMAAQTVYPIGVGMFAPVVAVPIGNETQAVSDLAAPQLVMLANVALTSENNGCDCLVEEKQMVELKTVCSSYSDSEDEGLSQFGGYDGQVEQPPVHYPEAQPVPPCEPVAAVEVQQPEEVKRTEGAEENTAEVPRRDPSPSWGKRRRVQRPAEAPKKKKKPFHCKPCQYQAECEEEFVHHIHRHSAKKLMVVNGAEGEEPSKEPAAGEGGDTPACAKGVIRCDRCGYNTNRYDHYVAHLKHHTKEGDSQRVYKCTICTYTTVSQYHWKKHLRNHFPSKLYTCSQCCYFSDRKNNYVQHIRTHTGERPFRCPYCEYSSSQKTHLTRHMRTHSGERPFKCETCSYLAANQHEVTRHARQVHNGPKPLRCPHCQYKTADRSNYKKHVELHINPRQFLCPVCSYAASKKCNLQYHIKSRHPNCSEITMDVSKVKLRVKKPDANTSSNTSSTSNTTSTPGSITAPTSNPSSNNSTASNSSSNTLSSSTSTSSSTYYKVDGNTQYMLTGIKEKKIAKQVNGGSEDQQTLTPINLSMKKPSRPSHVPIADKERKDRMPKRGEQATNKGGSGKMEKVQAEDKSTEKQSVRAERLECREKSTGKVQRKDEKSDHNGKRTDNSTSKVEKKKEAKKSIKATRTTEDNEVKPLPKRGRMAGKMTISAEEKEKVEKKERVQRAEKEKLEKEMAEKDKTHKERLEKEREEKENIQKEREEKEQAEKQRMEKEREERERVEKAEKQRLEKERQEKERVEKERLEKEMAEKARLEKEMAEKERMEKEKAEQAEKERVEGMDETTQTKNKKIKLVKRNLQKIGKVTRSPQDAEQERASSRSGVLDKTQRSAVLTKGEKRKADGMEPSLEQQLSRCRKSKRRKGEPGPQAASLRTRRKALTRCEATKGVVTTRLDMPDKGEMRSKKAKGKRKSSSYEAGAEEVADREDKTCPVEAVMGKGVKEIPVSAVHPAGVEKETSIHTSLEQKTSAGQVANKEDLKKADTSEGSLSSAEGTVAEDRKTEVRCGEICSALKDTTEVQKETSNLGEPSSPLDLPTTAHKPSDTEEDEGIHSHDGSDISDNISEGSDDSGLSGSGKLAGPETPTEAQPTPLASHTCIFCDRTFPMEVEYRRHLNRHLVNVYYLESATKGDE
ncbi:RE1-silencing transcription factor [Arapaima gigas]